MTKDLKMAQKIKKSKNYIFLIKKLENIPWIRIYLEKENQQIKYI